FELGAGGPATAEPRSGEAVYAAQCAACHGAGVAGAPKMGDAAAWEPRFGQGLDALVQASVNGKGAMPPQGATASELEIARAVVHMANASGGQFEEPKGEEGATAEAPADAAPAAAAPAPAPAPAAAAPADAALAAAPAPPPAASAPAAAAAAPAAGDAAADAAAGVDLAKGKQIYDTTCMACHMTGAANAPKMGDKARWEPLIAEGMDKMVEIAIKGKGAMPPKGGRLDLSDDDIRATVAYMVSNSQ